MVLTILTLSAVLLGQTPASSVQPAQPQESEYRVLGGGQAVSLSQMLEVLAKMDVVFVGEQHDHKLGHALQLEILRGLHARRNSTGLSLEMFERDTQLVLDEYLAGQISEASFLQASRPWPAYRTDYAPMVEFCKANRIPVIAANAPRRYANLASRKSLEELKSLSKEARGFIAKLPVTREIPAGYRIALDGVFGGHGTPATGTGPAMPAHIRDGQFLWDATMADSIAKGLKRTKARPVVQMNGSMHSDHGYGIVDRLRRMEPKLKLAVISIKPDAAFPDVDTKKYEGVGDYVIVTAPDKKVGGGK